MFILLIHVLLNCVGAIMTVPCQLMGEERAWVSLVLPRTAPARIEASCHTYQPLEFWQ